MAEVRWTSQAVEDPENITNYIAANSLHHANLFAMDVLAAVERLVTFPASGRVVPELNEPSVREIILGAYRIVYRIKEGIVEIMTVYHGARLLDPSKLRLGTLLRPAARGRQAEWFECGHSEGRRESRGGGGWIRVLPGNTRQGRVAGVLVR